MATTMSFYKFMIENHVKSNSPAGDLARDMKEDRDFPKLSINYDRILNYLESNSACMDCIDAFNECWNEYMLWREQS